MQHCIFESQFSLGSKQGYDLLLVGKHEMLLLLLFFGGQFAVFLASKFSIDCVIDVVVYKI